MIAVGVLQSMLDPAGPQAAHISRLWWLMFWVAAVVFVTVISFIIVAPSRTSSVKTVRAVAALTPTVSDDSVDLR